MAIERDRESRDHVSDTTGEHEDERATSAESRHVRRVPVDHGGLRARPSHDAMHTSHMAQ